MITSLLEYWFFFLLFFISIYLSLYFGNCIYVFDMVNVYFQNNATHSKWISKKSKQMQFSFRAVNIWNKKCTWSLISYRNSFEFETVKSIQTKKKHLSQTTTLLTNRNSISLHDQNCVVGLNIILIAFDARGSNDIRFTFIVNAIAFIANQIIIVSINWSTLNRSS